MKIKIKECSLKENSVWEFSLEQNSDGSIVLESNQKPFNRLCILTLDPASRCIKRHSFCNPIVDILDVRHVDSKVYVVKMNTDTLPF